MRNRGCQTRLVRARLSVLAAGAIALILVGCFATGESESDVHSDVQSKPPNVVLFMADDMGWGDSAYAGNRLALTPNLDEMAASGLRMNRFYAAAPVCSPTRGSVLTGRHPFRYGVYYANVGHLPEEEFTLAEALRNSGYRTGFFGKWHLGTLTTDVLDANRGGRPENRDHFSPPQAHGFDVVFSSESKMPTFDPMIKPAGEARRTWWDAVSPDSVSDSFGTYYWDGEGKEESGNLSGDDTRVIVDRAIPFINEAAENNEPFFAVIWTHAPHLPVVASADDRASIPSDDPYTTSYFGSIRALDREVGRVRSILRQAGVEKNTIFWFTSDNGPEQLFEGAPGSSNGLRGSKRSLYEGGIRVPGIVEWPEKIQPNSISDKPAVTSDILPTLLDLLSVRDLEVGPLDGESLKSVFLGTEFFRRDPIGFESAHQIAMVSDRYKIIYVPPYWDPEADPNSPETELDGIDLFDGQLNTKNIEYELYDLILDPNETTNVADNFPEVVDELSQKTKVWRNSVATSIGGADYAVAEPSALTIQTDDDSTVRH